MTHTTTAAHYVCLSYTWGEPEVSQENWVLVNGKRFDVRQNLLNFLYMMQKKAARDDAILDAKKGYWIDALCIDQENTGERNHQVAQMGAIFSRAQYVHVWLGTFENPERVRLLLNGPGKGVGFGEWSSLVRHQMEFIEQCIFRNKYWTRAWVIQEILLAQRVQVSLGMQQFAFPNLIESVRPLTLDLAGTHFEHFAIESGDVTQTRDKSLVTLLHRFRGKDCSVVQDRIFSLISLCNHSEGVPLRYDLPKIELAYFVLKFGEHRSCPCSARIVAQTLALETPRPSLYAPAKDAYLNFDLIGLIVKRRLNLFYSKIGFFSIYPEDPIQGQTWSTCGTKPRRHPDAGDIEYASPRNCAHEWLLHFMATLMLYMWRLFDPITSGLFDYVRLSDMMNMVIPLLQKCQQHDGRIWYLMLPYEIGEVDRDRNLCSFRLSVSSLAQDHLKKAELCSLDSRDVRSVPADTIRNIHLTLESWMASYTSGHNFTLGFFIFGIRRLYYVPFSTDLLSESRDPSLFTAYINLDDRNKISQESDQRQSAGC
jgi:hypothetical protein